MITRVAAVALVAAMATTGGAHAAMEPHVTLQRSNRAIPLDAGYLVEVVCTAQSQGGSLTQLPVITAVTCALDDYVQSQAVPGDFAAVTLTSAVTGPFQLCVTGEATFLDPVAGSTPYAVRGPDCHTVYP